MSAILGHVRGCIMCHMPSFDGAAASLNRDHAFAAGFSLAATVGGDVRKLDLCTEHRAVVDFHLGAEAAAQPTRSTDTSGSAS